MLVLSAVVVATVLTAVGRSITALATLAMLTALTGCSRTALAPTVVVGNCADFEALTLAMY